MQGQQTGNQNSNNQGNNNLQGTDNIEGSTIRRVTEGELVQVTDDRVVRWTPINIEAENASARITGENNRDIEINKTAISKTGTNLVRTGEEITYNLQVKITEKKITKI